MTKYRIKSGKTYARISGYESSIVDWCYLGEGEKVFEFMTEAIFFAEKHSFKDYEIELFTEG